jgi:hypothetical protein
MILFLVPTSTGTVQDRRASGRYKGFLKEKAELNKIEVPVLFKVAAVAGRITYGNDISVPFAAFEIRDDSGRVVTTITDADGKFSIPNIAQGKYIFKATKNGFYSTVGTISISPKYPNKNTIIIFLELGA